MPSPTLAAALDELEMLDHRDKPMLAAHWVAQGLGGVHAAAMAGLQGEEREVRELWRLALMELGVSLPVHRARRAALPWLIERMTSSERDLSWLVQVLSPERVNDPDDELDRVVLEIDTRLDYIGALEERRTGRPRPAWHSSRDARLLDRLRAETGVAGDCLLRGEVAAAVAALGLPQS